MGRRSSETVLLCTPAMSERKVGHNMTDDKVGTKVQTITPAETKKVIDETNTGN